MSAIEFSERLVAIQKDMWRFAYSLTADYDDACDLLQETSLKALMSMHMFTENTNFKGWLCIIMRNLFITHVRQTEHHASLFEPLPDDFSSALWSEPLADDGSAFDANESREIYKVFSSVPMEERRVFSYFVIGYKYREIAEMMHLPMGTVKSRIFNTRRRLQILLRDFID